MLLEFDPQSGTAQVEDYLQLFVPARAIPVLPMGSSVAVDPGETSAEVGSIPANWWPILRKFHGRDNWPSMAMVLPGEKCCFLTIYMV